MAEPHRPLKDLSDAVGMSKGGLEQALKVGAIPTAAITRTEAGFRKVADWDTALAALKRYQAEKNPTFVPPEGDSKDPQEFDFAQARAMREYFAALREKLKYEREAGELIERTDVERAVTGQMAVLKDRLLEVPARVADELAALSDAYEVEVILEATVRDAIADIRLRIGESELLTNDH